jgi:hypothetical protein
MWFLSGLGPAGPSVLVPFVALLLVGSALADNAGVEQAARLGALGALSEGGHLLVADVAPGAGRGVRAGAERQEPHVLLLAA